MTVATTVWKNVDVVQNFCPTSSNTKGAKSPALVRKPPGRWQAPPPPAPRVFIEHPNAGQFAGAEGEFKNLTEDSSRKAEKAFAQPEA